MAGEIFGTTEEGEEVRRIAISGGGLTAHILTWGAVIQDLRLAGHAPPLVLGFESFADYPAHSPHFGALAGPTANRIADARFAIDGTAYQLDRNFLGRHNLHGGSAAFGKRNWQVADAGADFVTLVVVSPDGEAGYPGRLETFCTYRLAADGALRVELRATTDRPTLCNLAQHSYFNLDDGGATPILDHRLEIEAGTFLPVTDELIPTGKILPVAGTVLDFRKARPIRCEEGGEQVIYDHNFCLAEARGPLRRVATVTAARSGLRLDVATTEPGIQFYAGHKVKPPVPGLEGIRYAPWSGLCLEPQIWPDAINHEGFPSPILRPGETYDQISEFRFARG
ncbi:aldose epimerase family protein [Afifella sp. IM 167]|uniref:aldose epimerase family protein n=1 Tax=Afifella sp. IM 167 TaxID=2033586 RepID=UPI001CCC4E14|nr:aldose epimerase family protein [Afifella sp. IM 167]MBZ8134960.1 galactose-1-epimerase [Afifella sp. IM 167]